MATKTIKVVYKNAVHTESYWNENDPVIGDGVIVYTKETNFFKIGDGSSTWSSLPYNSTGLIDKIFPIGHILMTTNDVNPGTLYPGTEWERWAEGKFVLGCYGDTVPSDVGEIVGQIDAPNITGGVYKKSLVADNIPSHRHTINHGHSGTVSSHAHNFGATTGSAGKHRHYTVRQADVFQSGKNKAGGPISHAANSGKSGMTDVDTSYEEAHTHSVSGTTGESGATCSIPTTTGYNSGYTGSGKEFSIIPPFITCFMWKRIN